MPEQLLGVVEPDRAVGVDRGQIPTELSERPPDLDSTARPVSRGARPTEALARHVRGEPIGG